jgi:hypothetical protein
MFTLKQVKVNGGLTVDTMGKVVVYRNGYQVSKEDLAIIPVYKVRKSTLLEILNTLNDGECLGMWIDSGKMYIDCSERIGNKRVAIKVGKARNQLSIYNWKTGDCIPCLA